ncbi:MAG: SET domain-containing protein-lysine N-methyltransferase [Ferruginibacter sp.]
MITTAPLSLVSNHVFAEVWKNATTGQQSLHATRQFHPGDIICSFGSSAILEKPTYLTVQTAVDKHILLEPEFLQYINHSCNPNVFFNTTSMELICLNAVQPDEEFTFFYPSTEWKMDQPFECYCGSRNCLQQISGAAHLPKHILNEYRFTDFIEGKLQQHEK